MTKKKRCNYFLGENICKGYFGAVRYAECHDPFFDFEGLEVRRCVIKTIYLKRRFESILNDEKKEIIEELRLFKLYRRTLMQLYILNRCIFVLILLF